MIAKWKVNLLLALSTFTLVGVGFSSWVISGSVMFESETVNLKTDYSINAQDCFVFPENDAVKFEYGTNGFYYDETYDMYSGGIFIYFSLDINKINESINYRLTENNVLSVKLSLSSSSTTEGGTFFDVVNDELCSFIGKQAKMEEINHYLSAGVRYFSIEESDVDISGKFSIDPIFIEGNLVEKLSYAVGFYFDFTGTFTDIAINLASTKIKINASLFIEDGDAK